jgi:hypothetical protein
VQGAGRKSAQLSCQSRTVMDPPQLSEFVPARSLVAARAGVVRAGRVAALAAATAPARGAGCGDQGGAADVAPVRPNNRMRLVMINPFSHQHPAADDQQAANGRDFGEADQRRLGLGWTRCIAFFVNRPVTSVPPSRFGDDRHIVKLVGKLLNTSDELGTAEAIASDRFKAIITGEPLTGRDVYRPPVDFRPQAQHVFVCNQLPAFHWGMDRGVIRRLMPIVFNRTIPEKERIPNIGQRIVVEELDLVLALSVRGAARLLERGHFPELASSLEALQEWAHGADPVLGWMEDRVCASTFAVVGEGPPRVRSRDAYDDFKSWAVGEGYSPNALPNINNFVQRVRAAGASKGITYKHSGGFRGFVGMRLRPLDQLAARAEVDAA